MSKTSLQKEEIIIQGVAASPGVAMGSVHIHQREAPEIKAGSISKDGIAEELASFLSAKKKLKAAWQKLRKKEKNKESKAILAAQIEIMDDPELQQQIEIYIKDHRNRAQNAINKAFKKYIDRLSASGNKILANRTVDLSDIRDRLIEATGAKKTSSVSVDGDIIVCEELSPREVIQLSHQHIKGFIMERGGNTSHAAIIARSVGIPAVVGAKGVLNNVEKQSIICIDGERGVVSINPSEHTRKRVKHMQGDQSQSLEEQVHICKKPSETKDGTPFVIRANVEFAEELTNVQQFRAEGIGLLRTESIYLNHAQFGSIEKQASFYSNMLKHSATYPVTIRLFDVGGDKFQAAKISESNPFLGWRGIRMLLDERTILREQLKAILMTSGQYPNRVKLLVPMVSTLQEIREVKKEITLCRKELIKDGYKVDKNIDLGIMVEIPSVALQAENFALEVDFFSIGTNDLTQYLLAVDRGNALISKLYNQAHPAVWRAIKHIVRIAQKYDIEVDVCGELAANPVAAACLLGMGVSSLSMSPVRIPHVKQLLLQSSLTEMQKLAGELQSCTDTQEVETLFKNWKNNLNDA